MKRITDISQPNSNGFVKSDEKSQTLAEYVYHSRNTIICNPTDRVIQPKPMSIDV